MLTYQVLRACIFPGTPCLHIRYSVLTYQALHAYIARYSVLIYPGTPCLYIRYSVLIFQVLRAYIARYSVLIARYSVLKSVLYAYP